MPPPSRVTIRWEIASPMPAPGSPSTRSRLRRTMSKTTVLLVLGDPDAVVLAHHLREVSVAQHPHAHLAAWRAVLHGIADDVAVGAGQHLGVDQRRHRVRRLEGHRHAAGLGLDLGVPTRLADEDDHVDLAGGLVEAALLDPGQRQQVVDETGEPLGAAADGRDRMGAGVGRQPLGLQELGVERDRGQRSAQVVGDRGDQVAAVLVQLPQLVEHLEVVATDLELAEQDAEPATETRRAHRAPRRTRAGRRRSGARAGRRGPSYRCRCSRAGPARAGPGRRRGRATDARRG